MLKRVILYALFVVMVSACTTDPDVVAVGEVSASGESVTEKLTPVVDFAYFKRVNSEEIASSPNVRWTNFGPALSGYCEILWLHNQDPNHLYSALDMGNAYYTSNMGGSWMTILDWDTQAESGRFYWGDFSYQNPDFALVIDEKGALMETTNRGHTFEYRYSSGTTGNVNGYSVNEDNLLGKVANKKAVIAVDPSDDDNWYIGAGQPWQVKEYCRTKDFVHGGVQSGNSGAISLVNMANTSYGYILYSHDKGVNWGRYTFDTAKYSDDDGNPILLVFRIYVHPGDSNKVIAITNFGVMVSYDKGMTWSEDSASHELYKNDVTGLYENYVRDGAIYYDKATGKLSLYLLLQTSYHEVDNKITARGGVYRNDNFFASDDWENITTDLGYNYTEATANGGTDWRFSTTVKAWHVTSASLSTDDTIMPVYNRIRVSPNDPNEIYLSTNCAHDHTFGVVEMSRSVYNPNTEKLHWYPVFRTASYWNLNLGQSYWDGRSDDPYDIYPNGKNATFAHVDAEQTGDSSYSGIRFLDIDAVGNIYAVCAQQMFRSTDKGDTWQQIDDMETSSGSWVGLGCSNLPGDGLEHETHMKRKLFRAGEHGLWVSSDSGDTGGYGVSQLVGQSKFEEDCNCYDGVTDKDCDNEATSICAAAVNPQDTTQMFVLMFRQTNHGELLKSEDCGETWFTQCSNIYDQGQHAATGNPKIGGVELADGAESRAIDLLIDPTNTQRMYFIIPRYIYNNHTSSQWTDNTVDGLLDDYCGVKRSVDGGKTWEYANSGLPDDNAIWSLSMDPENSMTLYACHAGSPVTKTGGTGEACTISSAAGLEGGALYKSTDGASTWSQMTIPDEIECVMDLFIDRTTGELYLCAGQLQGIADAFNSSNEVTTQGEGGVWSSTDGGESWTKIFYHPYVKEVFTCNSDPNVIAVNLGRAKKNSNVNPGAFLSYDGGSTWIKANYELGQPSRINDLRPDPEDKRVIWCALYGSGWYRGVVSGI